MDTAPTTRADWAHWRLKTAILTGELPPGSRLMADELSRRWQVSPTPLREAFQRLGGTGLVELTSQRGARVASFSPEEAAELYELRLLVEPVALQQSLEHSDDAHRAAVVAAAGELDRRTRDAVFDPVATAEAHLAFHAALLAACPSAWLRRVAALLAEHAQRYQILAAQGHRRGSDPRREHEALCEAAVRGKVSAAVRLLTDHLHGTLRAVRAAGATVGAPATPPARRPRARRTAGVR